MRMRFVAFPFIICSLKRSLRNILNAGLKAGSFDQALNKIRGALGIKGEQLTESTGLVGVSFHPK